MRSVLTDYGNLAHRLAARIADKQGNIRLLDALMVINTPLIGALVCFFALEPGDWKVGEEMRQAMEWLQPVFIAGMGLNAFLSATAIHATLIAASGCKSRENMDPAFQQSFEEARILIREWRDGAGDDVIRKIAALDVSRAMFITASLMYALDGADRNALLESLATDTSAFPK